MSAWTPDDGFYSLGGDGERLVTRPKDGDAYFGFVESMDEFGSFDEMAAPPEWLTTIRKARNERGLPDPSWVVWLDCVHAGYFLNEVTWREEPCEINVRDQAERRRQRIATLNDEKFRVASVLLSDQFEIERRMAVQFGEASWHRITLGNRVPGIPAIMADNFELDGPTLEQIQIGNFSACPDPERLELLKVFNLNFIEDAGWDEQGGEGPQEPPPNGPKDWEKAWQRSIGTVQLYTSRQS